MKKILLGIICFSFASCFAIDAQIGIQNLVANELAKKGIITKQDNLGNYNTASGISRAELVAVALKVKGINLPPNYTCKNYFEDVSKNDWVCRAVEIAADNAMISKENKKFRPNDSITYTEGLSILYKASGLKPSGTEKLTFKSNNLLDWQKKVLNDIYNTDNFIFPATESNYSSNLSRGSVFEFITLILNSFDAKNTKKITYALPRNPEQGQSLVLKKGNETIYVDGEIIMKAPVIIDNLIIYQWESTGGGFTRVYDIQKEILISQIPGENNVSSDGKVIYNCKNINAYNLFSFEKKRVLYRSREAVLEYTELGTGLGRPAELCNYSMKNNGTLIYKNGQQYILEKEWENPINILDTYYGYLGKKVAYNMRTGNSESFSTFSSWYKNTGTFKINPSSIKSLGGNIYEFIVGEWDIDYDYTKQENVFKVINQYSVKSKVNVQNFTIDNISSAKL